MLETLDEVAWDQLQHAYGPATDVPDLLRKVASGSEADRERALRELWGNVWHQGTVYEASAQVVPYLSELARASDLPIATRASLLHLIGSIAGGSSYLAVHGPLIRGGLTEEDEVHLAEEIEWVRAAREAVATELTGLVALRSSLPGELHGLLANIAAQLDTLAKSELEAIKSMRPNARSEIEQVLIEVAIEVVENASTSDDLLARAATVDEDLGDQLVALGAEHDSRERGTPCRGLALRETPIPVLPWRLRPRGPLDTRGDASVGAGGFQPATSDLLRERGRASHCMRTARGLTSPLAEPSERELAGTEAEETADTA